MESHRIEKDFLRYHGDWLNAKIVINIPGTTKTTTKTSGSGRPRRGFEESSYRSKMRMVEEMTATTSTPALTFATEKALRAQGRDAEAGLVKEALHSTPTRASKIADAWKKSQSKESKFIHPYSPEEALSLMIEADLSHKSYQTLRSQAIERGSDLYPSYKKVLLAKQKCYPCNTAVIITERKAEVNVQALLDMTVSRIAMLQADVMEPLSPIVLQNLHLICEWGLDGSSSQSM
ncbi:uncharacterized protein LOC124156170 [Ischnura elegans]|uniref:uncharacterized protein LOC124156170 n=1 Tax=Ischnura elegans TaxID=197161 RepID=UPI001ED892B3|nr:uncharacterized protein LOC124156170 [Ischnura elegans]